MAEKAVMSTMMHATDEYGNKVPFFPITRTDEVYHDIKNGVTLKNVLENTASVNFISYTTDDIIV